MADVLRTHHTHSNSYSISTADGASEKKTNHNIGRKAAPVAHKHTQTQRKKKTNIIKFYQ